MRRRNDLIPHRGHLLLRLLGVQSSVKKLGIQFNPLRGQMVLLVVVVALRLLLQPLQVLLKNWLHSFKKNCSYARAEICTWIIVELKKDWKLFKTCSDLVKNKMVSNVYKIWLLNTRLLEEIKVEDFHSLRKKKYFVPLYHTSNALARFLERKYFYSYYVLSLLQLLFLLNGNQNNTPFWGHIWALTSS